MMRRASRARPALKMRRALPTRFTVACMFVAVFVDEEIGDPAARERFIGEFFVVADKHGFADGSEGFAQLIVGHAGAPFGSGRPPFCAGVVEQGLAGGVFCKCGEGFQGAPLGVLGADFSAQRRFPFVDKPGRPPFHVEWGGSC